MQDTTQTAPGTLLSPEDAVAAYRRIRGFSERLCEPLAVEVYVIQTTVETSPPRSGTWPT